MKKLSLYIFLVLMWCNVGFADAKSNECLAIEDICIGDSALDFFTEKEIKDNQHFYYKDKKFATSTINYHLNFKIYDGIEIDYKFDDKKYIIHYISGLIYYKNSNFDNCLNKKEEAYQDISETFKNKGKTKIARNGMDEKGESKVYETIFFLDSDIVIVLNCYDWSERMEKRFTDNFTIYVTTKNFFNYQNTGVYETY